MSIFDFLHSIIHSITVLKSAFSLAVSTSLVLTAQALTMRDTSLYKRSFAEKETGRALFHQRVVDCVEKSVGIEADRSSPAFFQQVVACVNTVTAENSAQGMFFVSCAKPKFNIHSLHHPQLYSHLHSYLFFFFAIHSLKWIPERYWGHPDSFEFWVRSSWSPVHSCRSWWQ